MTRIPITERETVEYALSLPTILRVCIKTGEVLVDRRDEYYPLWFQKGVVSGGNGQDRYK